MRSLKHRKDSKKRDDHCVSIWRRGYIYICIHKHIYMHIEKELGKEKEKSSKMLLFRKHDYEDNRLESGA